MHSHLGAAVTHTGRFAGPIAPGSRFLEQNTEPHIAPGDFDDGVCDRVSICVSPLNRKCCVALDEQLTQSAYECVCEHVSVTSIAIVLH